MAKNKFWGSKTPLTAFGGFGMTKFVNDQSDYKYDYQQYQEMEKQYQNYLANPTHVYQPYTPPVEAQVEPEPAAVPEKKEEAPEPVSKAEESKPVANEKPDAKTEAIVRKKKGRAGVALEYLGGGKEQLGVL